MQGEDVGGSTGGVANDTNRMVHEVYDLLSTLKARAEAGQRHDGEAAREIERLRAENAVLYKKVEGLQATIEDTHDDYMIALWEVTLLPIAKTLGVDNVDGLHASHSLYKMVDAILAKCKEIRRG